LRRTARRRVLLLLGFALPLLGSAPARATDVRLGAGVAWARDASYDAFRENDLLGRFDLCLAYTVFAPAPLRIDVELGYGYVGNLGADVSFAALETGLDVHDAYAGLRASLDAPGLSWLRPYARIQGGLDVGLASFYDSSGGATYEDWDVGGTAYAGGGVEFVLPSTVFLDDSPALLSEPFGFGVFVEGGYLYRSPLGFSPSIPGPENEADAADRIPASGFAAGDVDLSGGELRVGFVARL
jgi:hypothetical protein